MVVDNFILIKINIPPPSRVSSEGGGGVVGKVAWLENIPLRLTFRVREGGSVVRKHPPPSRISSEGGGVVGKVAWLGNIPLRLTFRVREGVVV